MAGTKLIVRTVYECPICKKRYDKQDSAKCCLSKGLPKPKFRVGDVVRLNRQYTGWYDGDKRWIAKCWREGRKGQRGDLDFGFDFYFVVVGIETDRHDPHVRTYVLVTEAMTGEGGYRVLYETHLTPCYAHMWGSRITCGLKSVARPPKTVRDGAKAVLSWWSEYGEDYRAGKQVPHRNSVIRHSRDRGKRNE